MDALLLQSKHMNARQFVNKNNLVLISAFSLMFLIACSSSARFTSAGNAGYSGSIAVNPNPDKNTQEVKVIPGEVIKGFASFYGDEFDGRLTSNGEVFDQDKFTAAHKTLPFGTRLRVTNLRNNKSVYVRVNDRGPFVAGREIDLSRAAAENIDMVGEGVAKVAITILK